MSLKHFDLPSHFINDDDDLAVNIAYYYYYLAGRCIKLHHARLHLFTSH